LDIVVNTHSPYLNKYENDEDSEFKLEEKPLYPDLIDILLWKVGKVLKKVQNIIKTFV
jgi:hypothetical protein